MRIHCLEAVNHNTNTIPANWQETSLRPTDVIVIIPDGSSHLIRNKQDALEAFRLRETGLAAPIAIDRHGICRVQQGGCHDRAAQAACIEAEVATYLP